MDTNPSHDAVERRRHFASGFIASLLVTAISIMMVQSLHGPQPGDISVVAEGTDATGPALASANVTLPLRALPWFDMPGEAGWNEEIDKIVGDGIGLFRADPNSPVKVAERRRSRRQAKEFALARLRNFIGARKARKGGPEAIAPVAAIDVDPGLFKQETRTPAETGAAKLPEVIPVPTARPELTRVEVAALQRQSTLVALGYAPSSLPRDGEATGYAGLDRVFNTEPGEDPGEDSRGWKRWGSGQLPGPGSRTAVYDITAKIVHMPDGTKLQVHSGLGPMMDNPKYFKKRGRGPTPPNVYNLRMREALFHGVEAIRLLPVNQRLMYGRNGILAHSPLRRGSLGSAGCIAFQDYKVFLKAFKAGKVKQVVVVPHLGELPRYLAMR